MFNCLVVGAGGFLGSVARYLMGLIPVPTIGINICGGFTTFSTFSLDAVDMLRTGAYLPAVLYMVLSVVLCLAATVGGQLLVR